MPTAIFDWSVPALLAPGKVLECSVIGFLLVLASIFGGQAVAQSPALAAISTMSGLWLEQPAQLRHQDRIVGWLASILVVVPRVDRAQIQLIDPHR